MGVRPFLISVLFLFAAFFSPAQSEEITDSAYRQQLLDANGRKERIAVLMAMPESFIEENAEEALGLTNELLERIRRDDSKLARAHLLQGIAYFNLDRYDEADEQLKLANNFAQEKNEDDNRLRADIEYYLGNIAGIQGSYVVAKKHGEKSLEFANLIEDEELTTYILSELAIYEENLGNIDKAIEYHQDAYVIDMKRRDSSSIVADLNNMAYAFSSRGDYDKALNYYKEAHDYFSDSSLLNLKNIAMNYSNIGNTYIQLNKPDSALLYLERGLNLSSERGLDYEQISILLNYTVTETLRKNYGTAQEYLSEAELLINTTKANNYIPKLSNLQIDLYLSTQQYGKAWQLASQVLNDSEVVLPPLIKMGLLLKKSDAETSLGRHAQATKTLKNYIQQKDLYNSNFSAKEFERFRTIYELDKRDLEIENLNQQAELQKQSLKLNKAFSNVLIALFLLSIGFLLFLRNTFNQRRRIRQLEHEREMSSLNTEISTMQGRIAGLLDQQPELATTQELPAIEQINSALMDPLTEREYEILKAMEEGQSNKEIGAALYISVNTVKYHLKNIYLKLDANNRVQALQKLRSI